MKPQRCCGPAACDARDEVRTAQGGPRLRSLGRRGAKTARWVLPSAAVVLMPKCPACLAAYVAIATGASISLSMAAQLRLTVLVLCVGALAYQAAKVFSRRGRFSS